MHDIADRMLENHTIPGTQSITVTTQSNISTTQSDIDAIQSNMISILSESNSISTQSNTVVKQSMVTTDMTFTGKRSILLVNSKKGRRRSKIEKFFNYFTICSTIAMVKAFLPFIISG